MESNPDDPQLAPLPSSSARHFPPFGALRAFDAVARLGSIRKAARSIARDHTVVSRHVRSLESWTGVALVRRTAAGIELTTLGEQYHKQIAQAIDTIGAATRALTEPVDDRRLRVQCMPAFALHWLGLRVGDFQDAQPQMALDIRPTDVRADFSEDRCDVDIRLVTNFMEDTPLPPGIQTLALINVPIIAVASPEFVAEQSHIRSVSDLAELVLLHEGHKQVWVSWFAANGLKTERSLTGPVLWQGHLTLDAAKKGRGVALTNTLVAAEELETGELVNLTDCLPTKNRADARYVLFARASDWDIDPLAAFRHWLCAELAMFKHV